MQFQTPQFIEVENKIFGPFTFKQFIYLAGGAGLVFILYSFLPFFIAIFLIVPVAGLSLALAFYKVNNMPFINVLEASFKYFMSDKLYIWKKTPKKISREDQAATKKESSLFVPRLSDSKLKDISWSLDVEESIYADQQRSRNSERLNQ